MDVKKEMEYAENFKAEDACYIKAEMEHGVTQLVVSGGPVAIPYALMLAIRRTSILTGAPFEEMIEGIKALKTRRRHFFFAAVNDRWGDKT